MQNKIGGIWKMSMTNIPKICIWDCCRGSLSSPVVMKGGNNSTAHKDELFCSLYGNTMGVVSKGNVNGSFFTKAVCESLKQNKNIDMTDLSIDIKKRLKKITNKEQIVSKEGDPELDKLKICKK